MEPIQLTEAARAYLLDMLDMMQQSAILLRVTSKGCGGHTYQMSCVDPEFGGDSIQLDERHRLIIEQRSLMWLIGTEIDYEETALDSQLIFRNPLESGRCGCGQSFTCRQ